MLNWARWQVRYARLRIRLSIEQWYRRVFKRDSIHRAASAAAEWWVVRLNWGDKGAFAAALTFLVEEEIIWCGKCRLECDYEPMGVLADALQCAGINFGRSIVGGPQVFPLKHLLLVTCEELIPKEGYGNWTAPIALRR